jgi:tetratricopeptide (TPR) repeat protein
MTPEIYIEQEVVAADGGVSPIRLSLDEVDRAIVERLARYRDEFPEFAAALDEVIAPFERADPEAAEALRYSMVARDAAEIASWMGIDEQAATELARRGADAIAEPLGERLEARGLIVTTFVDDIEPIVGTEEAPATDRAPVPVVGAEESAPRSLLELWRAGREDSAGWPAIIADVAARGYARAKLAAADIAARFREENWETYSAARERFALHDIRDDTFLYRAVAAATAGHGTGVARALQTTGRVARAAVAKDARDGDDRKALDQLPARLHREDLKTAVKSAVRRGLGARRAAWLARWESRRQAKAVKAIEALEPAPRTGAPAPRPDSVRHTIPPDLSSAIDEVAGSKGKGKGDYRPLAIFTKEGRVLVAGVAPSYEVLIEAAYRKAQNLSLLAGADLRGIHLEKLDLSACARGASWRGVLLDQATLIECNLSGVDLQDASIERAKFTRCSLAGASFADASMRWTLISDCDLARTRCTWKNEKGLVVSGPANLSATTGQSSAIARAFYREGLDRQRRGHFAEASHAYKAAVEREPKGRYEYAVALGDARFGLGDDAAGDAYRRALAIVSEGRGSGRAFETYFALAASAARQGNTEVAEAALKIALRDDVGRTERQTYRAERQYGLLAEEPLVAIEHLRRAFNYHPPVGMNDRQVAWRLAETSVDAYVQSIATDRDPTLLDTSTRAIERLQILERGTPDKTVSDRLETLATRLTELRRHDRAIASSVASAAERAERDTAAGPVTRPAPSVSIRPEPEAQPARPDEPVPVSSAPKSAAKAAQLVWQTKTNVKEFFDRQLANAKESGSAPLVERVEAFQSYFREEMARIEQVSPGPELWTRERAGAREPLDGWEFVSGVCRLAGTSLLSHVDGLSPKAGEKVGAIRTDGEGRLLGPKGEVIVDRAGEGLHAHLVAALKSQPATQVFLQALGESYSTANQKAIIEGLETRGATFVAENAGSVEKALDADGGVQAQIELIDLVSKSDRQLMHELCARAKEGAKEHGRPPSGDAGPSL